MAHPKISIITVCYNAEKHIRKTMDGVFAQTYANIEYIIIDGGSKDGTVAIIREYESRISYWVSEKDGGLYDAMNKGLSAATGDYVFFLNADDQFYDNDVLSKVVASAEWPDVYYGDVMVIDEHDNNVGLRSERTPHKVPLHLHWRSLQHGMVVSHQAFFVKRTIAPLYNLSYKIASDIDWMIKVLKQAKSVHNTHLVIAKFRTGGSSKQRQKLAWKERYQILGNHYGVVKNFLNHAYIAGRYIINKPFQKEI